MTLSKQYNNVFFAGVLMTIVAACMPWIARGGEIHPERMTCEYRENPLGIDDPAPRFSWLLSSAKRNQKQSAYEIIVSDNKSDIERRRGNVWTSGKIESNQNVHVVFQGKPLQSFTRYFWRVRVYDGAGKPSKWSEPNWFETAAFHAADWTGQWIGDGRAPFAADEDFYGDDPAPLFRKTFDTRKTVAEARLYISGLGYYEAYLNGDKVGDHVLDPGWTAYDKQVLYVVHDITPLMRKGQNTAGIMLGNGWYNPLPLRFWGALNWRNALATDRPKVVAMVRVTYTDGSSEVIGTDETWQTTPGPTVKNNIYLGEHYDARLADEDWCSALGSKLAWKPAAKAVAPKGVMTAQQQPPIRVTNVLKPVGVKEVRPGVFVFDMGQNFAGVAGIRVKGPAGTVVRMRYGEDAYADGSVNLMTAVAGQIKASNGGPGAPAIAWQEDSYTLKGQGVETWAPRFTFHGFRYVEVSGWPGIPTVDDIEGLRMNADLQRNGQFSSSNTLFNRVDELIQWTFLSNVFSVVSDCPAREKLAYGGDILCAAETFMFNYHMPNFYVKTVVDHANDQRPLGGITETAPFVGIADDGPGDGSGPLGYQAGYSYLVKKLYDFYGDRRIVEQHYDRLRKQAEFLSSRTTDLLFATDLGDHESLTPKNKPLTASIFYYFHVKNLAEFAGILANQADESRYSKLAAEILEAIKKAHFDSRNGQYGTGSQSDQLFGIWSGLLAGEQPDLLTMERLLYTFEEKDWHLSTGIFGTKMLFDVFRAIDRNDVAYRVANQRSFPGWGHMVEGGATTLWETWQYSENTYSHNHPMFGSIGEWFYRSLLGINEAAPGFKRIEIKPQPTGDLSHAQGEFQSVYGTIGSAWKISDTGFDLKVDIPVNTQAEIWIPLSYGNKITETGKLLHEVNQVTSFRSEDNYAVVEVGSGKYHFQTTK